MRWDEMREGEKTYDRDSPVSSEGESGRTSLEL